MNSVHLIGNLATDVEAKSTLRIDRVIQPVVRIALSRANRSVLR